MKSSLVGMSKLALKSMAWRASSAPSSLCLLLGKDVIGAEAGTLPNFANETDSLLIFLPLSLGGDV